MPPEGSVLNLALLPNFCALLVFIGAFRPLVRRAGSHTNAWFLGWVFLLGHLAAQMLSGPTPHHITIPLIGEWALELGGIWFLRAAVFAPRNWRSATLSACMALPIFLQSALVILNVRHPWLNSIATLLMIAPAVFLYLNPQERSPVRIRMARGFFISSICLSPFAALDAPLALSVVHCLLFLGSAALYWENALRKSPGVLTAVSGLAVWGLTYPLSMLIERAGMGSAALEPFWQLPMYVVAYGMILTLIEEHVRQTEALALHDALTGLPNRRLFEDRLAQALELAPNTGAILACLIIDVDDFKRWNDHYGHATGDGVLEAVAARLSWHIRPGETLARTGGDEFAVVLPCIQSLEHLRFTVGAMMSATSAPVIVGKLAIRIGISIGIALYPDAATDAEGLRRQADAAMYEAKRKGGNQFAYAGGPPDELARLLAGVPQEFWPARQQALSH